MPFGDKLFAFSLLRWHFGGWRIMDSNARVQLWQDNLGVNIMAFRDIKVFGKSETLLDYGVAHIGEMSAFVQAGNTRPVCLYSSNRRYLAGLTLR
jgi:hypothetical protein